MNPLMALEQAILTEGREWTRQRLERQAQKQIDDWGGLCPQSGNLLKRRKKQRLTVRSCAGGLELKSQRGYSAAVQRWVNPARERRGLKSRQRVSPERQSRLVFNATATGSHEKAAAPAGRWGTPVSDDTVPAVVQQLGGPASVLVLPPPQRPAVEPEFSLVIMMDGWRVRRRGQDWGAGPRKKAAERVEWKEVENAVIYRLEQSVKKPSGRSLLLHKYVAATPPETSPVNFGAAVLTEARRRGLGRARKVCVVMDGAVWLWNLTQDCFSTAIQVLDFHHASEHLRAIAHLLHGQGTEPARDWMKPLLHQLRHGQDQKVVGTLAALLEQSAGLSAETQRALQTPVEYFKTHREHIHYGTVARQGGPIGSGSVESLCGQFQDRCQRTGQFWKPSGLRHLLRLDVLLRNGDLDVLWN